MREYNSSEMMELVNSNPTRAALMLATMVQDRDQYIKKMQETIDELNVFLASVSDVISKINIYRLSISTSEE